MYLTAQFLSFYNKIEEYIIPIQTDATYIVKIKIYIQFLKNIGIFL